jgi:hypothetical protein
MLFNAGVASAIHGSIIFVLEAIIFFLPFSGVLPAACLYWEHEQQQQPNSSARCSVCRNTNLPRHDLQFCTCRGG